MKILCIGNSFSQDATRYLSRIGKAAGTGIKTVNLYIGGCPLKTHYFNVLEDQPAYAFEFNWGKYRNKSEYKNSAYERRMGRCYASAGQPSGTEV